MITMRRLTVTLGLVIVTAGCYEHTFTYGQGTLAAPIVYEEWHSHWLGGLIGERNVEVQQFCPSGNATVHDEYTFLNGLVGALTGGIFTPTTVTIRCEGGAAEIELPEEQIMVILASPSFLDRVEELLPGRLEEARRGAQALAQDR